MGLALGWVALALAGVPGAPNAEREQAQAPIKYTVRFVEADGLGWREPVFARLTPVTRQGAATVWTAPCDVKKHVLHDATEKGQNGGTLQASTVIAWPGTPVHITTRANRQLVTQAAWSDADRAVETKPETVRAGSMTTMAGRKLDQGVLVQMVLQDTQILAVHRVTLGGATAAATLGAVKNVHWTPRSDPGGKGAVSDEAACEKTGACAAQSPACCAQEASESDQRRSAELGLTLPSLPYIKDDLPFLAVIPRDSAAAKAHYVVEPVRHQAMATEPLQAMARAGMFAAAAAQECCSAAATCASCPKDASAGSVSVEVPEIGSQEIAGEWLIPNDGILLVSFGPHTAADKDGKAVIRERLAIVEAELSAEPAPVGPSASAAPMIGTPTPVQGRWSVPAYSVPVVPGPWAPTPVGAAGTPPPALVPAPAAAIPSAAMPPMPSRSIPQGYHKDGKPADLPPLPANQEAEDDDAEGSAEPRPSPQTKKPRPVAPPADAAEPPPAKPTADSGMKKAQFTAQMTAQSFPVIPSLFQPAPTIGLQFLIPIKPVSLRLPFNRRLEIEIFGRVVRNPDPVAASGSSSEVATRPSKDGATTK